MASLTKCPNGHMYDAEKTPQCPHCRGGGRGAGPSSTAAADGFGAMSSSSGFTNTNTAATRQSGFTSAKTVAFDSQDTQGTPSGIFKQKNGGGGNPLHSSPTTPGVLLHSQETSAGFGGATGQTSGQAAGETKNTTHASVFNPAVGWLVALAGSQKGQDYRLVVGKNAIGRDAEANVRLGEDGQISRSHATIYYYPKVNEFYIEDHSSHGTYLNGRPIVQRTLVANMDKIEIGGTTLLLRALCDSGFIWDEFK